jgi:hypothetical protein
MHSEKILRIADVSSPPIATRLEESGTVTRCEITTYEADDTMEMGFDDDARILRLVMKVRTSSHPVSPTSRLMLIHTRGP